MATVAAAGGGRCGDSGGPRRRYAPMGGWADAIGGRRPSRRAFGRRPLGGGASSHAGPAGRSAATPLRRAGGFAGGGAGGSPGAMRGRAGWAWRAELRNALFTDYIDFLEPVSSENTF